MRPRGATFWRIGGSTGWRRQTALSDLAVSDAHGLRLTGDPKGPLSLTSVDGSVGGLMLPRGMALDEGNTLFLLVAEPSAAAFVKRFDPETRTFKPLPEVGGAGGEPRRFLQPGNIAIAGGRLYVADTGNRRVQVFDLESLMLVEVFDASGERADWSPVDVAEQRGSVYVLDAARARVYRRARTGHLVLEFEAPQRAGQWSRVLVDRGGTIYLLNAGRPDQPVLETTDLSAAAIYDAGAVRDLFESPAIRLDERGRFCLPESLARVCGRSKPTIPLQPEVPLALCPPYDRSASQSVPASANQLTTRTAAGWWLLYAVQRELSRVDAFTANGRRLRHTWGAGMDWQPCDVAARGRFAFVLDEKHQSVYRHQAGYETLQLIVRGGDKQTFWSRIALDDAGLVYLYESGQSNVQVFDCRGMARGEAGYRAVSSYFETSPSDVPPPAGTGLYFDRSGAPIATVDASEPIGAPFYRTSGTWQSKPLDSQQYRCQWHLIEIYLAGFPPSCKVNVSTFAHESAAGVLGAPDAAWQHAQTLVAPGQPPSGDAEQGKTFDFLVQSGGGQFLSLRVKMESDGFHTPQIDGLKVHYPRESYLMYLPATYSADDESRLFLERFLSVFQTEWDRLDALIDEDERYFDPDAVPAGPFLDYLAAQWLGLTMERTWSEEQQRRLLSAVPKIFPHRGQTTGLRDFIAVHLANFTGMTVADVQRSGFPVIVEAFRDRQYLVASEGDASRIGYGAPLWSDRVVRRLQLGVFSQAGEAALVSTGDPEHDALNRCAHRFRVTIPGGWIRTSAEELILRRAIDAERPAQTAYDLCLVQGRFRVGAQSTIGVDTIIGAIPATTLGCATDSDAPPSLPPSGRLGYDTVLNAAEREVTKRFLPGARLDTLSVLA
jgi:phage tail-like protein